MNPVNASVLQVGLQFGMIYNKPPCLSLNNKTFLPSYLFNWLTPSWLCV